MREWEFLGAPLTGNRFKGTSLDDNTISIIARAVVAVGVAAIAVAVSKTRRKPKPPKISPSRSSPPAVGRTALLQSPYSGGARPAPLQPKTKTLGLDAPDFTPISSEDARKLAFGVQSAWRNPFFGRRDLIPPASDPRTNVIDRAMVGQGLITPEELDEIHRIGAQMEEVRPDLAHAHARAQQAVQQDQAAREELKKQKKAEAAQRKRLHAEAVAKRKATDIFFLGRGVSKGLSDRRSNVEKLAAAGLPVMSAPADVAKALSLTIPRLRWLAFHSDASQVNHYVRFSVPKKSGGMRNLSAPHEDMAAAQEWILTNILSKVPTHDAAHGFVKTRSTISNARPHLKSAIVLNADLKDFFPTIGVARVAGIFRQLGYSPAVATVLALLCTECPRREVIYASKKFFVALGPRALPQGACTSPALSNLAARRMDSRLTGIAKKLGWTYTRYADDLTFSSQSDAREKIGYVLARIRHITQDEGFEVNEAKTRVLKRASKQTVTGIVVNQRMNVPRKTVRRIRAILHRAKTEGLAAQNREKHPHFEAWVRGMIAYIHMVNPQQALPLRAAYDAVATRG